MNIVLIGAPGSGKGTQGDILAGRSGVPKIATGDLLRAAVQAQTTLGKQAQAYMDGGLLVPDEVILSLIEARLASDEAADGVIMDGFPRTMVQARAVDGFLSHRNGLVDKVVAFDVPEEELLQRIVGRAGAEGRSDDTPETIRKRLRIYRRLTAPLLQYYEKRGVVQSIDGTGTIDEVAERVANAVAA